MWHFTFTDNTVFRRLLVFSQLNEYVRKFLSKPNAALIYHLLLPKELKSEVLKANKVQVTICPHSLRASLIL